MRIQGSPDLHVDRGSTINLTCVISHRWNSVNLINLMKSSCSPEPPAYIFWYHNDEVGVHRDETFINFSCRLCRTNLHEAASQLSLRMGGKHKAILSSGKINRSRRDFAYQPAPQIPEIHFYIQPSCQECPSFRLRKLHLQTLHLQNSCS